MRRVFGIRVYRTRLHVRLDWTFVCLVVWFGLVQFRAPVPNQTPPPLGGGSGPRQAATQHSSTSFLLCGRGGRGGRGVRREILHARLYEFERVPRRSPLADGWHPQPITVGGDQTETRELAKRSPDAVRTSPSLSYTPHRTPLFYGHPGDISPHSSYYLRDTSPFSGPLWTE